MYCRRRGLRCAAFTARAGGYGSVRSRSLPSRFQAIRSLPNTIHLQPRIQALPNAPARHIHRDQVPQPTPPSLVDPGFWRCIHTWRRARLNTLRCLAGCTLGDFSAMWYLQSQFPDLGVGITMGISMTAGILTSLSLETFLLRFGIDALPWSAAVQTATGMSMMSMLAMEAAENLVDYALTGGVVEVASVRFWAAALIAMAAGFMAPLPWNYVRLKRFGKSCH